MVPVCFSPSTFVLAFGPASDLAPSRSLAFLGASATRLKSPIPYWSRTSNPAGAGDSNSGSVPAPVFGNAITSRMEGVLHRIDINLSNPVCGIAFGLAFSYGLHVVGRSLREIHQKGPRGIRARVRLFGSRGYEGCRRYGEDRKT